MIKTTACRQSTEIQSAGWNKTRADGPTPSDSGWPGKELSAPEQHCVHRYQFPPSAYQQDQCTGQKKPAQPPTGINFQMLREIVRRARQRHIDHRRKAEDIGYAEGQQRGFQDGYQEGYQKGFEAGHLAGMHESQMEQKASAEQWLALMNSLWNELYNLHQSTLLHLGQPLIELISKVVRQVVNHELATSRASMHQLITDSMSMLPDIKGGQLVINPVDRPLIDPIIKQLPEGWSIQEDHALTSGGCRLVTDLGDVDATVESRVTACIDTVHEQLIMDS
ncbi:FliH/SctL family protein [Endozoicomonas sp. GU-1]|uniref:FliH/SctL family protein n=1 Tax=Endozoicomonas sp. GU-1 TaxID=3009078 RepID=UPI0022B35EC1|nr:FliH/SctL family protein [Endozoicomonas sp. GU-1]WBA82503.1 FliH/SctL family protein [Endozoicomonas sp. GU-1]WBA85435.1 FliH/SctL family protein [Endozoicomonas sp. GU-1]